MDVRRRMLFNMNTRSREYTDNYLTILALEDGLTASLSTNACQYCIDGDGNWIDLPAGTATQAINQGQTLSFKGNLTPNATFGIGTFTINKKCNLEGNCMAMLFSDDAGNSYSLSGKNKAFYNLFYNCKTIIEVSETLLPATILAEDCYNSMFSGCSGLTKAPELPATTLVSYCYDSMFENCSKLTTAPNLPATTLASYCYNWMFAGCTRLSTAPELPATMLAENCYNYMFRSCKSLTTAPELPATTLAKYCYTNMFIYCTSLRVAPQLPATTLVSGCYQSMFQICSNLNYIKMLATDIPETNHFYNWVSGVSSTGTFIKHPDMTSLPAGVDGIPSGWTVLDSPTIDLTFPLSLSMDEPDTDLQKQLFRYLRIKYGETAYLIPIDEEIYVDGMLLDQYMFTPCSNISTFGCDYIQFHSTGDAIDIYLTPDGTWF